MPILVFLVPLAIATAIILLIAFVLKLNKGTLPKNVTVSTNTCRNLSITHDVVDKVNKLNSIPNDLFREDKSVSCLDFLYNQKNVDTDDKKSENRILRRLGGRI